MEFEKDFYEKDDYAGFLLRLIAYIIDAVIISFLAGILAFVFIVPKIMRYAEMGDEPQPEDIMAMMGDYFFFWLLIIAAQWLYYALFESSKYQATPGKLAVSIKVTDQYGDPVTFGRATGRYFGKLLSGAIMMIGYIIIIFTEKKQGLHDILANTLVIKKNVPPLRG